LKQWQGNTLRTEQSLSLNVNSLPLTLIIRKRLPSSEEHFVFGLWEVALKEAGHPYLLNLVQVHSRNKIFILFLLFLDDVYKF
jgi:hypothetical protein